MTRDEIVLVELLDGHQLDRGDAQVLQVRNLLDQTAIRPRESGRRRSGSIGVAAHVELVDDRRCPGVAERLIALPVEIRVGDDALRRGGRIVDLGEGQVLLGRRRIVADGGAKIATRSGRDRGGVGIHHELVRIEAMPFMRRVRSGDAKSVELAGPDPLQPHVPDVAGLVPGRVEEDAPGGHGILGIGKEVEADAGGVPAEDREVDAIPARMGPEGQGHARADGLNLAQTQQAFELGKLLRARDVVAAHVSA